MDKHKVYHMWTELLQLKRESMHVFFVSFLDFPFDTPICPIH